MKSKNPLLIATGWLLMALALFQAVISLSQSWSLYFGAGSIANNYPLLVILGELCAVIFATFGLYAFSGAGCIRRLPFVRSMLSLVSAAFILRGLLVIPQILVNAGILQAPGHVPVRMVVASLVALGVGILCTCGTVRGWKTMAPDIRA